MCLNFGIPKIIDFPFGTNGKFISLGVPVYLNPNEMSGQSYLCTCPQTILLSEKENKICTLLTYW